MQMKKYWRKIMGIISGIISLIAILIGAVFLFTFFYYLIVAPVNDAVDAIREKKNHDE
jgi:uncharacterized protein involved in cysteine biosynthesis